PIYGNLQLRIRSRAFFRTGNLTPILKAGGWEPDEPRGSRPVLREPGGAIPPGYSPAFEGKLSRKVVLSLPLAGSFQPLHRGLDGHGNGIGTERAALHPRNGA